MEICFWFFFSSRRRHTRCGRDWSSDVCSSDLSLQPARAAAEATKTIPVVFVVTADPVGQGLVANLARPAGNVTGLATYVPGEISERILQILREVVPHVSRLALLTNPANPVHRELMSRALPSAAQQSRL